MPRRRSTLRSTNLQCRFIKSHRSCEPYEDVSTIRARFAFVNFATDSIGKCSEEEFLIDFARGYRVTMQRRVL